ncbi:hypothetical protein [Psychroserpens algicola]|uniref:Holin-X, holin superfamily III n=1 Tax=Psychroserpens algicola TaxID=1719034 RepID=A0ABT0HCH9_9FLAO|nr:hypothetical protein [Psychroserpens algicola]MCK8482056.1 hypothetical protein [Psychroserpens algicola]
MTVFESLNNTTDKATDTAEKYVKTSQQYFKLKVFQQLTISLSLMIKLSIIGGLITLALIFMAVAGAIEIGKALDSLALGYAIVGLVFIAFAVVVYYTRKIIDQKIIKVLSNKFFD